FDYQYQISNLDLAVLRDVGYELNTYVADDFTGARTSVILWTNSATGAVQTWLMTNGQVTSATAIGSVSSAWQNLGIGDFNGDGKADMLWRNTVTGEVGMWEMNGTSIALATDIAAGIPNDWSIGGVGDFSGDGNADMLWRNTVSGEVGMWEMNGT